MNGPFVGSTNNTTIFIKGLGTQVHAEEAVEADSGYTIDPRLKGPEMGLTSEKRNTKSNARAQQEAINAD